VSTAMAGNESARPGQETLSADVFSHLSRLELLSDVSNNSFNAMSWDHKVTCFRIYRQDKREQACAKEHKVHGARGRLRPHPRCHTSLTMFLADASEQEALFVSLLDRLGRPTLGQYARERRSFQKRPPDARLDRKKWSEETFRGIFLKIVLKDLKDVGFARVLSVDDLLTKRRRWGAVHNSR